MSVTRVSGVQEGQKELLDPLKLELQRVGSCPVGAQNLCRSSAGAAMLCAAEPSLWPRSC